MIINHSTLIDLPRFMRQQPSSALSYKLVRNLCTRSLRQTPHCLSPKDIQCLIAVVKVRSFKKILDMDYSRVPFLLKCKREDRLANTLENVKFSSYLSPPFKTLPGNIISSRGSKYFNKLRNISSHRRYCFANIFSGQATANFVVMEHN